MTIAAGTRLGPYEIVSRIGAGGMGEVWKARDTRLDRSVAIKVLPAEFASNAEFKMRFEREAKTISQLEHPHICRLYDVGDDYLVMELLEGESLADRLSRGPLPLPDVLRCGAQIADALDRAHRSGVVHRDLKPANIMLTKSGAKLLDFGLARSRAVVDVDGATVQKQLTQEGTILGTFQYMAPEQLEGIEADARTDIFAFGAVVYEMATGRRAFEGKTKTSLIAAIVKEQPRPVSQVTPLTPPSLDHIIARCLEKDPDDRWQSAHDVAEELRWVATATPPVAAAARGNRLSWAIAAIMTVVALAASFAFLSARRSRPKPVHFQIHPPRGYQIFDAPVAVSPDGRHVAFLCSGYDAPRICLQSLDQAEPRALEGTGGAWLPFWSPDSQHIGFFADGKLQRIDIRGGPPEVICETPARDQDARGAAWGRDGNILFAPYYEGVIQRVPASGGRPVPLTKLSKARGEISHRWPQYLPDGKHFLYVTRGASEEKKICIADLDGREIREVGSTDSRVAAIRGSLMFVRDGTLVAQRFDARDFAFRGNPEKVADSIFASTMATGLAGFDAAEGVVVYRRGKMKTRLTWFDRSGKILQTTGLENDTSPELSPDATRLALVREDKASYGDIWVYDLKRDVGSRLTFDPRFESGPVWSPDGRWIAYTTNQAPRELWRRPATGAGTPTLIMRGDATLRFPSDWSRDGKWLLFTRYNAATKWDVSAVPAEGNVQEQALLTTQFNEVNPRFSPDGRLIAYASDESGRFEVYVQTFPLSGGKWQISTDGGTGPRWRADGRELFYLGSNGSLVSVAIDRNGDSLTAARPQSLFQMRPAGFAAYSPTPDGKRFVVSVIDDKAIDEPITVILDESGRL